MLPEEDELRLGKPSTALVRCDGVGRGALELSLIPGAGAGECNGAEEWAGR
jgi:hypothetical protein